MKDFRETKNAKVKRKVGLIFRARHSSVVSQNYLQKKSYSIVIPVKTGIQNNYNILAPRLRGGDGLKLLHDISDIWY